MAQLPAKAAAPGILAGAGDLPVLIDVPESIATTRLTLRAPRTGDGRVLFEAIVESLAELRRFPASLPWAIADPTLPGVEAYCREAQANFVARRDLPYLIIERKSGIVVGSTGMHRIDWTVPKFEIGYWGRTSAHGRGFVTEAIVALARLAFDRLGAARVELVVDEDNERGWRVCERAGFTLEGTLRHERREPGGRLRNSRIYARINAPGRTRTRGA
jgi:RimJ/RimL family protein N-acetyltransferase